MQKNIYTYLLAAACLLGSTNMWAQRHYLHLVKAIDSAAANVQNQQTDFIAVGGETYFLDTKIYGSGAITQTIYKTDGTANGTLAQLQINMPAADSASKIQG